MTAVRTTVAAALTHAWAGSRVLDGLGLADDRDGQRGGAPARLVRVFAAVWVAMMAAMMLPGAAPAVTRAARAGGVRAVPLFAGSYLAAWALVGVVVYALYRPHGTAAAGAVTIAAGAYEFTPLKRRFRRRCRETAGSGFGSGCAAWAPVRADGDGGGAGRDERRLDGRDHRPGHRPKAPAPGPPSMCRSYSRSSHWGF
jgi:predicted metal-binding integral membrane protein DUF2182